MSDFKDPRTTSSSLSDAFGTFPPSSAAAQTGNIQSVHGNRGNYNISNVSGFMPNPNLGPTGYAGALLSPTKEKGYNIQNDEEFPSLSLSKGVNARSRAVRTRLTYNIQHMPMFARRAPTPAQALPPALARAQASASASAAAGVSQGQIGARSRAPTRQASNIPRMPLDNPDVDALTEEEEEEPAKEALHYCYKHKKGFQSEKGLVRHNKAVHRHEKYSCGGCANKFPTRPDAHQCKK